MQSPPPPPQSPAPYMTPQMAGAQGAYAGFWIRLIARIIDGVILGIPFGIVFSIVGAIGGAFVSSTSSNSSNPSASTLAVFGGAFILLYLVFLVIIFGYYIYFWGTTGSTLGMRLLRLRIVGAQTGAPIGTGMAVVRLLMTFVNSAACYIGWIWVAFDPRKQGWHDKVANSVVLHY